MAARLEGRLIQASDTSINYTYVSNITQFPLNQPLYLDMSHDNVIVAVLTALGLSYFIYGPTGLPENAVHAPERAFHLNEITPFGAKLASEIWTCPASVSFKELGSALYKNPDLSTKPNTTDYIRFVLNSAPLPLDGLDISEMGENGFCALKDFWGVIPQLKQNAEYQFACFGQYVRGHQVGDGKPGQ